MADDALTTVTVTLATADRLRDARDWPAAADAYAAWLADHLADWGIWVQHGHCVKEAGDPYAALASYRRAEAGLPGDPDVKVQIGHALKLAGDPAGARAAYAAALDLDGLNEAAWQEWRSDPRDDPPAPVLALPGDLHVVFDLSDLLACLRVPRAPTDTPRG